MASWALILLSTLGAVQVTASPHVGPSSKGELVSMDGDNILVKVDGQTKELPIKSLKGIDFGPPDEEPAPHDGFLVELIDGSRIPADGYLVRDGNAVVKTRHGEFEASTRLIRSVLFRSQRNIETLQKAWRELNDGERTSDLLVVRRTREVGGQNVEHTLDQLDCVLYDIDAKSLSFAREKDRRSVPIEKLEGAIYYHAAEQELRAPMATIQTHTDAQIAAHSWSVQGDSVTVVSRAGVSVSLPLTTLKRVRFGGGDVVYLSDLEPQNVTWRPFVPTRIGGDRLKKLYLPRFDEANDGGPLRLEPGGDIFEKGISVHSRTEIVYRLPDTFQRLQAEVGLAPKFRNAGNVDFIVLSESGELFRKSVTPDAPRFTLNVDLKGARRLTILVDFGEGWDVSDYLNLCDARLSK